MFNASTSKNEPPRRIILLLSAFFISITLFLTACTHQTKEPESGGVFKLHGIRYDSSTIMKWVNDTITYRRFVFQYFSNQLQKPGDDLALISYALTNTGQWANGSNPDTLKVVKDSTYNIKNPVVLGNIEKSIPSICKLVKNADGTIIPFDYIFFKPKVIPINNHLTYIIYVIKKGKVVRISVMATGDEELNPIPPGKPSEM